MALIAAGVLLLFVAMALELVYEEFISVIVRCCDAKITPQSRGGKSFEETLQNWLEYVVVPTYRTLIKDRKRGIAKDKI